MSDDIVISLDVVCKGCGGATTWQGDFNRQRTYVIDVDPCEKCLQEAAEKGVV